MRVEKLSGHLGADEVTTRGGIGIIPEDGVGYCTLGFNVRNSAGRKYFVTAGHCATTLNDTKWHRIYGNHFLGDRVYWDYGGIDKDYAVMAYTGQDVVAYGAVIAFGTDYEINVRAIP